MAHLRTEGSDNLSGLTGRESHLKQGAPLGGVASVPSSGAAASVSPDPCVIGEAPPHSLYVSAKPVEVPT